MIVGPAAGAATAAVGEAYEAPARPAKSGGAATEAVEVLLPMTAAAMIDATPLATGAEEVAAVEDAKAVEGMVVTTATLDSPTANRAIPKASVRSVKELASCQLG